MMTTSFSEYVYNIERIYDTGLTFRYKQKQPQEDIMNYSTRVFLINNKLRAIKAIYEPQDAITRNNNTPKMFKTLDPELKVGDYIVVPSSTRHKMTTMLVTEVDVDVDYDSPAQVDWVVDKIDVAAYKVLKDQEDQAIAVLKSAEAHRKREELKKSLLDFDLEKVKALPIYANGETK
jgi:hypothetical protein